MFDSHSKDKNSNISAAGTAFLLKFESLPSLENCTVSVYHANYPKALYFQIQFIRLGCTLDARNRIKNSIKIGEKILLSKVSTMIIQNQKGNIRKISNWKNNIRERKTKGKKV